MFGNQFGLTYNEAAYTATSTDQWTGNYTSEVGEAEVGDNGLTIAVPAAN